MDKYKKLINNSFLFAVGNFGSKLINLIMVPLYTFVLSPNEYGKVDLITTTVSLFLPIVSVSIGEAVIRFVMLSNKGKNKDSNYILSNAIFLNIFTSLFSIILYPLLSYFDVFSGLLMLFIIQLITSQFQVTFSQFVRGIGLVKEFAINGIIMTLITAGMNIILLVHFKFGLVGYLLSIIMANVLSIFYLVIVSKSLSIIKFKYFDYKLIKEMCIYSVPLIPNTIMWWLMNSSTRYIIVFFLGPTANGIFAVANKIPSILSMGTTIFQQAWQLSAFEEYKSKNKSDFFSGVFKGYYQLLFIGTAFILPFIQPVIPKIISSSFEESWKIIPFLLLAVVYQSFSGIIGTNYTAAMQTKGVFLSSIVGAVISIILDVILIPYFGILGAGLGTFISFFCMFIIRYYDTKKLVNLKIDKFLFLLNNLIVLTQVTAIRIIDDNRILFIFEILLFIVIVVLNLIGSKRIIINMIKYVFNKKNKSL